MKRILFPILAILLIFGSTPQSHAQLTWEEIGELYFQYQYYAAKSETYGDPQTLANAVGQYNSLLGAYAFNYVLGLNYIYYYAYLSAAVNLYYNWYGQYLAAFYWDNPSYQTLLIDYYADLGTTQGQYYSDYGSFISDYYLDIAQYYADILFP